MKPSSCRIVSIRAATCVRFTKSISPFFMSVENLFLRNIRPPYASPAPEGAGAYAMPPYYLCRDADMRYR